MKTEQPITYSIESIRERRLAKQEELKLSKDRMHNLSQQLFAPQQGQNKIDSLMQQINMGIAAYDGLMTGIKILRRVRGFFGCMIMRILLHRSKRHISFSEFTIA